MENTRNGSNKELNDNLNWNKEASEELVLIYLEDYYRTMDDYFLQEAFQIAKDEGIDIQKIMGRAKARMSWNQLKILTFGLPEYSETSKCPLLLY